MAKTFLMTIYKSSRWCKLLILILIILIFFIGANSIQHQEGFVNQTQKFKFIEGPSLYDSFYTAYYDDVITDKIKNEYEVGEIINKTGPTNESIVLDIGSGTGEIVNIFNEKNILAVGLDKSPSMVETARSKFPEREFNVGNITNIMLYPPHSFSHITCLNNTIYEIKDQNHLIKNCYEWLMPGGYLILHLSDTFSHLNTSKHFSKFTYKSNVEHLNNKMMLFNETFKDNTNKVRKQQRRMYKHDNEKIIKNTQEEGFILHGQFNLSPVNKKNENIYLFYKPE